jgi:ribose/xylose/arabinose/galactoside ABC-type transport system permease subunit
MVLVGSIAIGVILGVIIVAAVVADQYRQRNRRG